MVGNQALNILMLIGFSVNVNGVSEKIKVYVSKVAADLPAKADLLNMIQHNGRCRCAICEYPGFTALKGSGRNHSYAPKLSVGLRRRRTRRHMLRQA